MSDRKLYSYSRSSAQTYPTGLTVMAEALESYMHVMHDCDHMILERIITVDAGKFVSDKEVEAFFSNMQTHNNAAGLTF